ncbi:arylsulfotransferase family protein [Alloyangia pacifica]|uniref:arylsulfotransferase family protein n=1 Tax=Alloyangia pacifica TaxID=311180 RepID=UPI001CD5ABF1|nr:arylsulfotransferase family protein [Alloyangia pacifica]MCA0998773.1 arylsulfotransferase family protein [Alloyangia pacifica]
MKPSDTSSADAFLRVYFRIAAMIVIVGLTYLYGVFSVRENLFPYPQINTLRSTAQNLLMGDSNSLIHLTSVHDTQVINMPGQPDHLAPGLVMLASAVADTRDSLVDVIDRDGTVVQTFSPKWDEIWPDDETDVFGDYIRPIPGEGRYLHGLDVLPDGSIVANFEHLSTFRMDVCGNVLWKLPNLGHHAVHRSEDGTIWVTAETHYAEDPTGYANMRAPFRSWTIQQLDPETGDSLREIPVVNLLLDNGLPGLLYLSNTNSSTLEVTDDTLHLNDIDIFPSTYESDLFNPGDIMISLRNINAIFVFDGETLKLKFRSMGKFLRQHDPDFTPEGNITLFDNNNLWPDVSGKDARSYVLQIDVPSGEVTTLLGDTKDSAFFTAIMGTHQALPNGNTLLNVSGEGRLYEFGPDGKMLWRYSNVSTNGSNDRLYNGIVLPINMDAAFFEQARGACGKQ